MRIDWGRRLAAKKVGQTFLVAGVILAVHSVASTVTVAPEDPDDGQTFTSRFDRDGNTVRPAILGFRHAGDSLRDAELSYEVRANACRHFYHWVCRRSSDTIARGMTHTVEFTSLRAGEAFGIASIVLHYGGPELPRQEVVAPDTTARLDRDGHSVIPAEMFMRHAPDSLLDKDLVQGDGSSQDRFRHVFVAADPTTGLRHTLEFESLRAGEGWGIRNLYLDYAVRTDGRARVGAEQT